VTHRNRVYWLFSFHKTMNYKAAAQAIHKERVQLWIAMGKPWSEERVVKTRYINGSVERSMAHELVFPKTGWTQFHIDEYTLRYRLMNLRMMWIGTQNRTFNQFSTEQWNAHSQN
jgi:hypothetical protein